MLDKEDQPIVHSNCAFSWPKLKYEDSWLYKNSSPCTNVPLHCTLCPSSLSRQQTTFWKYNLLHHIKLHHLTDTGKLPPFPTSLRIASRISMKEERRMGIDKGKTEAFRREHDIPASDTLMEIHEAELAARKRAGSSTSNTSKSRQPSPSKAQRK